MRKILCICCIFIYAMFYSINVFSMAAPCDVPDAVLPNSFSFNYSNSTCNASADNDMLYLQITCEGTADNGSGYPVSYWMSSGYDYVMSYTPSSSGYIDITVNPTEDWAGLIISQGDCPNVNGTCLTHDVAATGGENLIIDYLYVTAGTTYYFVVSMWPDPSPAPQCTNFTLSVTTASPNPPQGDWCTNPIPICDFNGYSANTSDAFSNTNPNGVNENETDLGDEFCGTIENNTFISFVAGATSASLDIAVSNCAFGTPTSNGGIQMEIYSSPDCNNFTSVSNCWNPGVMTDGTINTNPNGLIIGQTYYLMVDGYAGDDCDYTITAQSGVLTTEAISVQSGTDQVTICAGQSTNLLATGGTTYAWSPATGLSATNVANPVATPIISTVYTVTITGGVNPDCPLSSVEQVTVTVNQIILTSSSTNLTCYGNNSGTASVTSVSGGTAPYTYSWSTGATTSSITGLAAGAYSVTVTDANGCQGYANFNLTQPAQTVLATSSVAATCGLSDGSATVTVTAGGVPKYTYNWSTGASTGPTNTPNNTINGLPAGVYTVTVTNQNGCTAVATVTVSNSGTVTAGFTYNGNQCLSNNGTTITNSFNFTNTGSSDAGVTYSWSFPSGTPNSSTAQNPSGIVWNTAGTYTVTQTVTLGTCIATATQNITVYPIPTVTFSGQNNVTCFGLCNGSVTANPGGAGYTYIWNDPAPVQTTQTATALCAGAYNVTVTSPNLCPGIGTVTITQPGAIVLNAWRTNILCYGLCTGTANVAVTSGGTAPFTYLWSGGGGTNAAASNLCAGTYTVTVTDANNCTNTASVIISQPAAALSVTLSSTNVTCNGQCNGTATATPAGGTAPYTYVWNDPAPAQSTQTATALCPGNFTVTVTDANSCTTTSTMLITQPPVLTAGITAQTNVSCNGGNNGNATVTAGGGTAPYTYIWNDPAPAQSTATVTGLTAGTWTVTVTDANSCTVTTSVTITQPALLTANIAGTNVLCNGGNTGSANLTVGGGTPAYTYLWSNAATTEDINNLTAGSYTVTVTDSKGCTATATVNITQPTAVTANITSQTNVSCNGGSNGSATVTAGGGTAPYAYVWNDPAPAQSTATVTDLTAGTWTVTVTDGNGCTKTASVTITQPTVLTANITAQTNVSCNGASTGSATVTAGGGTAPYNYVWNDPAPAQSTATVTGLTAGTWTVTVTDANGCTKTTSVTITQPAVLTANITAQTNVSCNGGNNGSATVTAGGGTAPYTYVWNDPAPAQSTASVTGLTAGTWTVTVTDANSCTVTANVTITQPAVLTANITAQTNVSCNGGSNGGATVTAGGGTVPYTYIWNDPAPAQSTATVTGLTAGTWTVTVTDANSCTATASVTITQPAILTANITAQTNVSCNGGANGSATVTAGGGTAPYNYVWNDPAPAQSTAIATGLTAGTWTVTVTDANSCTKTASVTITQPAVLTATITAQTNVSCNGGNNGSATVTAGGGTAPYTYVWNDPAPAQSTTTVTGLTVGTWTVTVSDANSCTVTTSVTITQPAALTASIVGTNVLCNGGTTGSANLTAGGGTIPYTYLWSNTATTEDINNLTAGTYTVTVTDANSCTTTASVTITQPTVFTVTITAQTNVSCNGGSNGSATVTAGGGTVPYTYVWNDPAPAQSTATVTGLTAGTWTVTVTDGNGCTKTASVTITQPAVLTANITAQTNVSCNGGNNGSATVTAGGGTAPYNYVWNDPAPAQSTATVTGLTAGTWTVTVTDANSCTVTASVTITQPAVLTANITAQTNISCNGGSNGSATITAGGGTAPYTYIWNDPAPAQSTATVTGLTAGTWTVTVTDADSCTTTASVVITQPAVLTATTSGTSVSCNGGNNGTATVTPSGGTLPYTYQWSNLQTTPTINGLTAGTYDVTVTDANSCTTTSSYIVTQP
ncbi:MAG: hypothetical protein HY738_16105, partial [Bacteroidia bacterium]|nr:hypothetical protein [Bacteroidia bacterium]